MTEEDKIRTFINVPAGDHDRLIDLGYMPSLQLLELVAFLEEEFGITLRPVDLVPEKLSTIAQIATMVRARITARR